MVSHPETGSDSPIESDRDRGRDTSAPGISRPKKATEGLLNLRYSILGDYKQAAPIQLYTIQN